MPEDLKQKTLSRDRILIGTHSREIHLVELQLDEREVVDQCTPDGARFHVVSSLTLEEQPSWIERHPKISNIVYVNSWVKKKLFTIWIDNNGQMSMQDQIETTGDGPTHFIVTEDSSALILVSYTGGTVERQSLHSTTGVFEKTRAACDVYHFPCLERKLPKTLRTQERQGHPHPHQVVPLKNGAYLIPDLGNDCVWYMQWEKTGWICQGRLDVEAGFGPRHGVISSDGHWFYLLHELSSCVTVHRIFREDHFYLSPAMQTVASLPPSLHCIVAKAAGFEYIACTILNTRLGDQEILIVSNRNADLNLAPSGDILASYLIKKNAVEDNVPVLCSPGFTSGYGKHLRGMTLRRDLVEGNDMQIGVVMGREGGEISALAVHKDGTLQTLHSVVFTNVKMPVVALWL